MNRLAEIALDVDDVHDLMHFMIGARRVLSRDSVARGLLDRAIDACRECLAAEDEGKDPDPPGDDRRPEDCE